MSLVSVQLLGCDMEIFPNLQLGDLCKVCTFLSLVFGLGPGCTLTLVDWSAIFVKTMRVTCVVALVWPSMLLAQDAVIFGPAHLLELLGNEKVN